MRSAACTEESPQVTRAMLALTPVGCKYSNKACEAVLRWADLGAV
jgi:hypothetical protein